MKGQASWKVVGFFIAAVFLLVMLIYLSTTKNELMDVSSLIQNKLRFD